MSSSDNVLNVTISSEEDGDFGEVLSDFEDHDSHESDENSDSDGVLIDSDADSENEDPDSDGTVFFDGSLNLSQFSTIDDSFARDLMAIQALSKEEVINKNTITYVYQRSTSNTGPQEACSICLDYFGIGQTIRRLPCFHQFHISCADDWLAKQIRCPECRTKITAEVA